MKITFTNKKNKRGFTLVELLVVIAIISLLSSIILASLNSVRVKARDAKRKADIQELVKAFSLYVNDRGSIPISADWCSGPSRAVMCMVGVLMLSIALIIGI